MAQISVELAPLGKIAAELRRVGEELACMSGSFVDAPAETTGSVTLAAALDHLCAEWAAGLRRAADDARLLGDQLDDAVRSYEQTDGAVAQACR